MAEKPKQIRIAMRLLYLQFVFGLSGLFLSVDFKDNSGDPTYIAIVSVFAALQFSVYFLVGKGYNWARIVIIILICHTWSYMFIDLVQDPRDSSFSYLVYWGYLVWDCAIIDRLYHKKSCAWFDHRRSLHKIELDLIHSTYLKPEDSGSLLSNKFTWNCGCGEVNLRSASVCRTCQIKKPLCEVSPTNRHEKSPE